MIPQGFQLGPDTTKDSNFQPTRTYLLDTSSGRVMGKVDGRKAMEQAIYKILSTERYEYLIQDISYGIELQELIGNDMDYVIADIGRRISEALMTDDRINGIANLIVNTGENKDAVMVYFEAITTEGVINIERRITL